MCDEISTNKITTDPTNNQPTINHTVRMIKKEKNIYRDFPDTVMVANEDLYNESMTKGYNDIRERYAELWDSLHKKDGFGWDTNCFVWVYEFEVLKDYQKGGNE